MLRSELRTLAILRECFLRVVRTRSSFEEEGRRRERDSRRCSGNQTGATPDTYPDAPHTTMHIIEHKTHGWRAGTVPVFRTLLELLYRRSQRLIVVKIRQSIELRFKTWFVVRRCRKIASVGRHKGSECTISSDRLEPQFQKFARPRFEGRTGPFPLFCRKQRTEFRHDLPVRVLLNVCKKSFIQCSAVCDAVL